MKDVHESQGNKYTCSLCGHCTKFLSSLKKHEQSVHEGLKYQCDECGHQSSRKENLTHHKKKKHGQGVVNKKVTLPTFLQQIG